MPEWLKGAVSKTVWQVTATGVQIPPSPPESITPELSDVQARVKEPVSQEDYEKFVRPYESDKELNRIRRGLNNGEPGNDSK